MDKIVTEDGMPTSRPKFWAKQIHLCEEKKLYRARVQSLTNPDYKIAHPAECRGNPEGKLQRECHPEAKIRILKELKKKIESSTPPTVKRPERFNRT